MKYKKSLKFLIFAALLVGNCLNATSQIKNKGFVGDDKFVLLVDKDEEWVELGADLPADHDFMVYYKWRIVSSPSDDPGELGSTDAPRPMIKVKSYGTYVCECLRISNYGYQREYVTVDVCDHVEIDDIEEADGIKCFQLGAVLHESDFKITTIPPGYDDLVELRTDYKIAERRNFFTAGPESDELVKFVIRRSDGTTFEPDNNWCFIKVVDPSRTYKALEIPVGTTLLKRVMDLSGKCKKVKNMMSKHKWMEKLQSKSNVFWNLDFNLAPGKSNDCCDNREYDISVWDMSIALEGGVDVFFPFPPFPNIGVDLAVAAYGSLNFPGFRFNPIGGPTCTPQGSATLNLGGSVTGSLALRLIPSSDVFSVSGGIEGALNIGWEIGPKSGGTGNITVSGVANVVALITVYSGKATIAEFPFTF